MVIYSGQLSSPRPGDVLVARHIGSGVLPRVYLGVLDDEMALPVILPGLFLVAPSQDTILGGASVLVVGDPTDSGVLTESMTGAALPGSWVLTAGTRQADGLIFGSSAEVLRPEALTHFDAELSVQFPNAPRAARLGLEQFRFEHVVPGVGTLSLELFCSKNASVWRTTWTPPTGALVRGSAVSLDLRSRTHQLRIVRNGGRFWVAIDARWTLAVNLEPNLSAVQAATPGGFRVASQEPLALRLREFTLSPHARIGPRLLEDKRVVGAQLVGRVPAATLAEVGLADVVVFGPAGEQRSVGAFEYTLPNSRTLRSDRVPVLRLVQDRQVRDEEGP